MIFLRAAEAEGVPAAACYGRYFAHKISLFDIAVHSEHTVRCRAPFEVVFVIDVRSCEELAVPSKLSVSCHL